MLTLPFGGNGQLTAQLGENGTYDWEVPSSVTRALIVMNGGGDNTNDFWSFPAGILQFVLDVRPGESFTFRAVPRGRSSNTSRPNVNYQCSPGGLGLAFYPTGAPFSTGNMFAVAGGSGGNVLEEFSDGWNMFYGGAGGGDTGDDGATIGFTQDTGGKGGSQTSGGNWNGGPLQGGDYFDKPPVLVKYGGSGGGGGYFGGGGGGTKSGSDPVYQASVGAGGGGSSYFNIPQNRNPILLENTRGGAYYRNDYRIFFSVSW